MTSEHPPLTIRDNPAAHRYETEVDGDLAVAYYTLSGEVITFTHAEERWLTDAAPRAGA